jgi:hypothetical protein
MAARDESHSIRCGNLPSARHSDNPTFDHRAERLGRSGGHCRSGFSETDDEEAGGRAKMNGVARGREAVIPTLEVGGHSARRVCRL